VVVPVTLLIAMVALIGAAAGFTLNKPKSYEPQLAALRSQIAAQDDRLAHADREIAALRASSQAAAVSALIGNVSDLQGGVRGLFGRLGGLRASLRRYIACLPQIQQEINGMSVHLSNHGVKVINATLQTPTVVSQDCAAVLYGAGR
jgi:hypothetical protein